MKEREKDETLVRQTISRLLDFQGMEIPGQGQSEDASEANKSFQMPASEDLGLSDPIAAAVAEEGFPEGEFDDWGEPSAHSRRKLFAPRFGVNPSRQKKMAMLIPVLSIVLLVVLNKFHDMPLLGGEWLRLGTYQAMVGDIAKSGFSSIEDDSQHPVRLEVRGIAYSSDKPSAVVGTTIVHEGDVILGATVVGISRGSVKFEVNGESWTQKVQ